MHIHYYGFGSGFGRFGRNPLHTLAVVEFKYVRSLGGRHGLSTKQKIPTKKKDRSRTVSNKNSSKQQCCCLTRKIKEHPQTQ